MTVLMLVGSGWDRAPYERPDGGKFVDVMPSSRITGAGGAVARGDYNGDDWLDVLLIAGAGSVMFFKNTQGRFQDVTVAAKLDKVGGAMAGYWGDYDNDGDPDLLTGSRLYRNDTNSGRHWLKVKLVGEKTNRAGIGARVTLVGATSPKFRKSTAAWESNPTADWR